MTQLARRFAKREEAKEGEEEAKETGECPVQRMQAELMGIRAGTAEDIDKLARRQVRVTKEHNEECKKLLALMGIPCVTVSDSASCQERQLISMKAPGEAEAQCAELARAGKVYAAGSEDMDTLTFNSPILLRHLTFSEAKRMPISEIQLSVALEELGMDMDRVSGWHCDESR